MENQEILWGLLLGWGILSLGLFLGQFLLTKRFVGKVEKAVGLRLKRTRVSNALDPKESALVFFDERNQVFHWNGKFEGHSAGYSVNAETGYASLKLEKGNLVLSIYQYIRNVSESRITSLIPHKMEINGRVIYNTGLLKDSGEKKLVYEILKDYFKNGVKRDAEFLGQETRDTLEALIFGYHTLKRFRSFFPKAYPDFSREIDGYQRKPVTEQLLAFQPQAKSQDELEIEIKKAIFEEDYMKAAQIRDQIRKLNEARGSRAT